MLNRADTGPSLDSVLDCAAEGWTQLTLLMLNALMWYAWISFAPKYIFEPYVSAQAWKNHWTHRHERSLKAMGIEFRSNQDVFVWACGFLAIACQHFVGGALCLPSVLGLGGHTATTALACHGAMCEVGWEVQDLFRSCQELLFEGEGGKAKNPARILVLKGFHHMLALSMVIPMNLYYRESEEYHEFVFLLQFAAAIAVACTNYGYTLDVNTAGGLAKMKGVVTVTWVVMVYSRVIRFAIVGWSLLGLLREDRIMYFAGLGALCLMCIFNALITFDATAKLVKFIGMNHKEESAQLHETADVVICSPILRPGSLSSPKSLDSLGRTARTIVSTPLRSPFSCSESAVHAPKQRPRHLGEDSSVLLRKKAAFAAANKED